MISYYLIDIKTIDMSNREAASAKLQAINLSFEKDSVEMLALMEEGTNIISKLEPKTFNAQ